MQLDTRLRAPGEEAKVGVLDLQDDGPRLDTLLAEPGGDLLGLLQQAAGQRLPPRPELRESRGGNAGDA